ncbi:MAG TPA: DUF6805 domain-containing protein, partial [Gemmatimonadaceae bacterium]
AGQPGRFRTKGVGREPNARGLAHEVDLVPFYRLHKRTYATYWDLLTPPEWVERKSEYERDEARQHALEAASVAFVQPGRVSAEKEFNYKGGKDSNPQRVMGRSARAGRSWFSYELAVDPAHPMAIVATYYSADRRTSPASFEIQVDGQRVSEQKIERTDPGRFFDISYPIPAELVRGKKKVTVRFQAKEGSQIAAVFGVRMVRADEVGS